MVVSQRAQGLAHWEWTDHIDGAHSRLAYYPRSGETLICIHSQ